MTIDLGGLAGGEVVRRGTGRFDALLVSRLDVEVRLLDVPPVARRDLDGLIRYQLRSRYPGNPRDTRFDWRLARGGRRALVFVTRAATADAYRRAAGRRPLLAPSDLVATYVPRRGTFRAWVGDGLWTEVLEYRDGSLVTARVVRRPRDGSRGLPRDGGPAPDLVLAPGSELAGAPGLDGARRVALESVRPPRGLRGLFPPPATGRRVPRATLAAVIAVAVAALGITGVFRAARREEARVERLAAEVGELETTAREAAAVRGEIGRLERELVALDAGLPPDRYQVLADLAAVFGDAARAEGVALHGDRFQVEARGGDPLAIVEALEAHGGFTGLSLAPVVAGTVPRDGRYSLSGACRGR